MRRAIQRCSAAVPRAFTLQKRSAIASISTASRASAQLSIQVRRNLHQTSFLRQQAAAVAEQNESPAKVSRFQDLETHGMVHPNIVRTLTRDMGLDTMTEVQSATIHGALKGTDIIAQAKTGTGKTLAFLLPVLQNIISVDPGLLQRNTRRRGPRTTADDIRALVISPTRELAEQIAVEAKKVVQGTSIVVQTAVGGTQKAAGLQRIQRDGCHLLVGTPGRLKDILSDPYTRVEAPDLSALVLDEADRLLDQGFWPEIQEIMHLLPPRSEKDRQTLMFSATVPHEVVDLVRRTLRPGFQFIKCVRDDDEPTHARVPQHLVPVNGFENKMPALVEIVQRGIEASKQPGGRPFKAIVFFNSTAEVTLANTILSNLKTDDEPKRDAFGPLSHGASHPWPQTKILSIHSKLTQNQRTNASNMFRACESGVLLSSDVTARGMDFPNVTHVIQIGLPPNAEQYVHRIGRTARAGREGEGWLILAPEEMRECHYRLRGLPIKQNKTLMTAGLNLTQPGQIPSEAGKIMEQLRRAMPSVSEYEKSKAYMAHLGVYSWIGNKATLIKAMNNLAQFGWGASEPPAIGHGIATKLGLANVPGVRIGHMVEEEGSMGLGNRGGFGSRRGFGNRNNISGGFGGRKPSFGDGKDHRMDAFDRKQNSDARERGQSFAGGRDFRGRTRGRDSFGAGRDSGKGSRTSSPRPEPFWRD
ncbi:hypothetical protein M433DRAFT_156643 [Acidomyces richmondensis BFW]|nr:MAG: hypothetical protein FE78DRAFT_93465 [Acidomyces sp. 'richmondensis']KYG43510.1 hypothetical protein M433DRAFT_156643 [Acidomyces richmondensis BFW]